MPARDARSRLIADLESRCNDAQMDTAHIIVTHTPLYVWMVLGLLLFLGVRRLKPRRTHLAVAALAPAAFFIWSVVTAASLHFGGDSEAAIIAWPLAFLSGALSWSIRTVPGQHMCAAGSSNMQPRDCRSRCMRSSGLPATALGYGRGLCLRWWTLLPWRALSFRPLQPEEQWPTFFHHFSTLSAFRVV